MRPRGHPLSDDRRLAPSDRASPSCGHVRGRLWDARECFLFETSELPSEEPERSMRILELLVRGFGMSPQRWIRQLWYRV